MSQCNDYIVQIFNNKKINELIKNIKPIDIQDDLKQELVIALYDYGCEKIINLHNENKLIALSMKLVWYMAIGTSNKFHRTYRKNDLQKAKEYLKSLEGKDYSDKSINIAKKELKDKLNRSSNEAHESIIFQKYVELGNCIQVAKFFNIPQMHVYTVVNKIKEELKTKINEH